jgi:hypothetical protein
MFTILNIISLFEIISKKNVKQIFLFICIYLFINLYLFPTYALCEIDPDLLDRENNTYKGSKIVYETPDDIITEDEAKILFKICDMCLIVLGATLVLMIIYDLTH